MFKWGVRRGLEKVVFKGGVRRGSERRMKEYGTEGFEGRGSKVWN